MPSLYDDTAKVSRSCLRLMGKHGEEEDSEPTPAIPPLAPADQEMRGTILTWRLER